MVWFIPLLGGIALELLSLHYTGNDVWDNIWGLIQNGDLPGPLVEIDGIGIQIIPVLVDGMTFSEFFEALWPLLLVILAVIVISWRIAHPRTKS